jgi:hypothetical protein
LGGRDPARPTPPVLDAAKLPPAETAELTRLVSAAKADPPAQEAKPGRALDAMSYTITVENGQRIVLTQSDASMSPAFAALLGFLAKRIDAK